MTKTSKIIAISAGIVVVLIAGIVIWRRIQNKKVRRPFSPRDLGPGQLQPTGKADEAALTSWKPHFAGLQTGKIFNLGNPLLTWSTN